MSLKVEIRPDPKAAAAAAASRIAVALRAALEARSVALLALSGGSTPAPLVAELARQPLDWSRTHIFQVDERIAVGEDHPARNWAMLSRCLCDSANVPPQNRHPMPLEGGSDHQLARAYEEELMALAGSPPVLDVVHLGLGADGHTASWPPGRPLPAGEVAAVGSFGGWRRLTLTPAAVNRARDVVWFVTGASKQGALSRLIAGDGDGPSNLVRRDRALLVADSAAAGVA